MNAGDSRAPGAAGAPAIAVTLPFGPIVAAVATWLGALAGEHAGPSAATTALTFGVGLLGVAWFVRSRARVAIAVAACAVLGGVAMQRSLEGQQRWPLARSVGTGESIAISGSVAADPNPGRFTTDVLVRVEQATVAVGSPTPAVGVHRILVHRILVAQAGRKESGRAGALQLGDKVTMRGRLQPLSGFSSNARWRHAVARLVGVEVVSFAPTRSKLLQLAAGVRSLVLRGADPLAPADRALLAGFLLGDTRSIPDGVISDFRAAGLTHLLAVSGANVAFVLAVVGPLLRRVRLGARLVLGCAVLTVFAAATRFEPSVLRASAMAALVMLASFVGRPAEPARLLSFAVVVLLWIDPFLVHRAGIVLLARPIEARLRGPRVVREALAVALAAQVAVAPVLLAVFGSVPLIAPVTNLLAVPVAEPLSVYALTVGVGAGVLASRAPPIAAVLVVPEHLMLGWTRAVAHAGGALPLALSPRAALAAVAIVSALGAVALQTRASRRLGAFADGAGAVSWSRVGGARS